MPLCGGEGGSAILGDGRVGGDSARVLGEEVELLRTTIEEVEVMKKKHQTFRVTKTANADLPVNLHFTSAILHQQKSRKSTL